LTKKAMTPGAVRSLPTTGNLVEWPQILQSYLLSGPQKGASMTDEDLPARDPRWVTRQKVSEMSSVPWTRSGTARVQEPTRFSALTWSPLIRLPSALMPQAGEALRMIRSGQRFSTYGLDDMNPG
jgi:hypothetical protein